jgi:crossover junction endodeoxyribonuclease RusA
MHLTIHLPYPPSVNHYWGTAGKRRYLTDKAKAFRVATLVAFRQTRHSGFGGARLSVSIDLHMPDARVRDIDNVVKSVFDSLCHAGAFTDDSQVDILFVRRAPKEKGGRCTVRIAPIESSCA